MPDHISHSQSTMILGCQAQYYFRYILGRKIPPSGALHFGRSFDDGMNVNYQQKIDTEHDLSVLDAKNAFDTAFQTGLQDVNWDDDDPGEARESGFGLVEMHMREHAPTIMPLSVQQRIELTVPGLNRPIIAIPDIITQQGDVIDIKTGKRSPSKDKAGNFVMAPEHLRQGCLYSVAHRAQYGRDAFNLRMKHHIRTKTPKIVDIDMVTTPSQEQFAVNQIARAAKLIDLCTANDCWVPNRGYMMCTAKACGFWSLCHETYGPDEEVVNASTEQ